MKKINYIFVATQLSLKIATKCIDHNKISIDESEFVIPLNLRDYSSLQFKNTINLRLYKKTSILLLLNLIFSSYRYKTKTLILCDLGLFNKLLIILMRYDHLYIVDDGLASFNRTKNSVNFLLKAAKIFAGLRGARIVDFYSIYPKLITNQLGFFDQKLVPNHDDKSGIIYKDTVFYIYSFPRADGMDESFETTIINFVKDHFLTTTVNSFTFLPHRRNPMSHDINFKFSKYLMANYLSFEDFYYSNTFKNCVFVTLYSGAICCVSSQHERYYIKSKFIPSIEKTLIQKIFFLKRTDPKIIFNYFEKIGIKSLQLKN